MADLSMNSVTKAMIEAKAKAKAKDQSQSNAQEAWRDDFTKRINAAKTDKERYKVVKEYQKRIAKGGDIAKDSWLLNNIKTRVEDLQRSGYLGKDGKPYSQQELNAALADQSWGSPDVKENLAYYGVPGKEDTQQAKDSEKALKAVADDIKTGNAAGENFKKYVQTDSGKRYTGRVPGTPSSGGTANGEPTGKGETPQKAGTKGNPSETTTPEEKEANSKGLLLADILMTGVKNALHYRPAFRTAYGEDIEGRDFGNEKSLAMKLAEENMKRGLERANSRKDYESQQQAEQEATKQKGQDVEYRQARQTLSKDLSPVTTTNSNSESHQNFLGGTSTAGSTTTTNWNNVQSSR